MKSRKQAHASGIESVSNEFSYRDFRQSCGNVLTGGLQRLMTCVSVSCHKLYVFRALIELFLPLSISLTSHIFFLSCRPGEFSPVVEKWDQIDISQVRYFPATFDINLHGTMFAINICACESDSLYILIIM